MSDRHTGTKKNSQPEVQPGLQKDYQSEGHIDRQVYRNLVSQKVRQVEQTVSQPKGQVYNVSKRSNRLYTERYPARRLEYCVEYELVPRYG
jgi:hypothetical protein